MHGSFRHRVHQLGLHAGFAQGAGQAEIGDEFGELVRRRHVDLAQRVRHQGLAGGVLRVVEAHDMRQHDAGGIAMRHSRGAAQHMADAMAGAQRNAGGNPGHRQPGADLTIQPCRQVLWIFLHPAQPRRQQPQRVHGGGIGERLRRDRAQRLRGMIHGTDAGGQEQPFGRVNGQCGVQNDGARDGVGMGKTFLGVAGAARVGAAGQGGKLPGRQCGRDGHGADRRRQRDRAGGGAVRMRGGAQLVEFARFRNVVAQADADHLGGVGDRAAADRQQHIRAGRARAVGGGDHVIARGVGADLRGQTGKAVAEHLADLVHGVGFPRQGAGRQHINGAGADEVDFLRQRLGEGNAVNHPLHMRIAEYAFLQSSSSLKNRFSGGFVGQFRGFRKSSIAPVSRPSAAKSLAMRW